MGGSHPNRFERFTASTALSGSTFFKPPALPEVADYSKGVPRYICQVADVALLAAYHQGKPEVDDTIVKVVVNSLSGKEGGK